MALPYFYISTYESNQKTIILDEDTSRHVVQVLRMTNGEKVNLTDGKGNLITTAISDNHKKHCTVEVEFVKQVPAAARKTTIAISLLKNTNRFEWFLEKATELGISEIYPLIGIRTEKEKFRHDRLQQIIVSAMLQSQQSWLPLLHQPIEYNDLFTKNEVTSIDHRFIAHCDDQHKTSFVNELAAAPGSRLILIGPEGDFASEEITLALSHQFKPVMLGDTRLRTETAGVVAASLMCLV